MTPQQTAMASILQVSLFKFAEEAHETIGVFSEKYGTRPGVKDRLSQLTNEVEAMVDKTIQAFNDHGDDFTMEHVDAIHAKLSELKQLRYA